jgi:hypothetical protein
MVMNINDTVNVKVTDTGWCPWGIEHYFHSVKTMFITDDFIWGKDESKYEYGYTNNFAHG